MTQTKMADASRKAATSLVLIQHLARWGVAFNPCKVPHARISETMSRQRVSHASAVCDLNLLTGPLHHAKRWAPVRGSLENFDGFEVERITRLIAVVTDAVHEWSSAQMFEHGPVFWRLESTPRNDEACSRLHRFARCAHASSTCLSFPSDK